jgi:hypothetical protein
MLKEIFYVIILMFGFVAGFLLAKLCKEEIRDWKEKLLTMSVICFILGIIILFTNFEYKIPIIISLLFIIITNWTIILRIR